MTGDFTSAVRMAVNHDGDSDTTGSLVGQLVGPALGEERFRRIGCEAWNYGKRLRRLLRTSRFLNWELDGLGTSPMRSGSAIQAGSLPSKKAPHT